MSITTTNKCNTACFCFLLYLVLAGAALSEAATSWNVDLAGRWDSGRCHHVATVGDIAYFNVYPTLYIVDFSTPSSPIELGEILMPSMIDGIVVSGSYAYVTTSFDGLRVIDVSEPSSPTEVGVLAIRDEISDLSGSYAYLTDGSNGFRIIDIGTPSNPVEAGSYDTPGLAMDVAVSGSYAYVADRADVRVYDVSTPSTLCVKSTPSPSRETICLCPTKRPGSRGSWYSTFLPLRIPRWWARGAHRGKRVV